MKSAIYSLAVGIWLANYAAAASFEGIIVANIGSDVERYLIQGNKLRIEGESSRGSKRESLILDFDAKKAFVLISNNSSLANDLWGDDITPPSRNRGIDGAPMSPRPNSKVMARATGKTATIKGYLAEQFIENFDNGRSREIWVTKQLDLAPVTTRRMREQSLIV